jgi:mono/diheme cytochrome c family protein
VIDALATEEINIDDNASMSNMATTATPASLFLRRPSAERGAKMLDKIDIPTELRDPAWKRTHTPVQALQVLMTLNPSVAQTDLADVVAYLWFGGLAPDSLTNSAALYAKNCAACHGENGDGTGPASGQTAKQPVAFTDFLYMTMRRSDNLYAKIRRGGMGTGMPNFGTLFTPDETWALVDYLWNLTFED